MRVGVPVKSENLEIFTNAGHTPFFAIFDIVGNGMFKSSNLVELRENPRVNLEAEFGCQHEHSGEDAHDEDDEEHVKDHDILGQLVHDCDVVLVKKACKNTANSLGSKGVKVKKIDEKALNAKEALAKAI